ncbi:MAG: ribosomal protein S18-alanine N-acetyltransferase [Bifidobacteriaceae bacterium]|nr:ribosomal protein S18-alanine N-acetyltransferase [Bifidobacteriaceae bacterium]
MEDTDQLVQLETECFGVEAWTVAMIEDEITGPYRAYLVAQAPDGTVLGYGGVFMGLDSAEIMTLAVATAARGQGLGRQLLDALIAEARQAGILQVMLEVAVDLEPAIGLYLSAGFENVGLRRNYYQPSGRDAHVMRLALTADPAVPR